MSKFTIPEKSNCHLHLTGSLPTSLLRETAHISDVDISEWEPLEAHQDFEDPNIWAAAKEISSNALGLLSSIKHIIDLEAADNVTYIEITINTFGMVRRNLTNIQISEALDLAGEYGKARGVQVRFKLGVNRKDGPQSIDSVATTFNACKGRFMWGIDLNGDETQYSTDIFTDGFRNLADDGIHTSIHAGEFTDQVSSLESALTANPTRICHGLAAICSQDIMKEIIGQGIVLEIAPTSNIKRGIITNPKNHPVSSFIRNGIATVFGNDDRAFFGSNMSDEFELLLEMGFSDLDILEIIRKINISRS